MNRAYHYDAHVIAFYLDRPYTMLTEWLALLRLSMG